MDKKLKACIEYIESEYKGKNKKASEELISYHLQMVQHFQHERLVHLILFCKIYFHNILFRLVHLIVTMFFALFLLIFFAMFIFMSITLTKCGEILIIGTGLITLILLITTLFYAAHYYKLENGTQRLEDMTRKLYGRDWWKNKK